MDAFFEWLSGNSLATLILLASFCVFVVLCVLAIVQGREVRFFPPTISAKVPLSHSQMKLGSVSIPNDHSRERKFRDNSYKHIRTLNIQVSFNPPFKKNPKVLVCLKKIDIASGDVRLLVRADNIQIDGFDMVFETWDDSLVYYADASWIAIGE